MAVGRSVWLEVSWPRVYKVLHCLSDTPFSHPRALVLLQVQQQQYPPLQQSSTVLPAPMDYTNTYSLPAASNTQYEYVDDGLGGLMDDGLGSSCDMPQSSLPPLDEPALDYFDNFAEPAAPPEQPVAEPNKGSTSTAAAAAQQSSQQPAEEAAADLDEELEAALDEAFADKPAAAAEASKSQQADDDSDLDTIDEAGGSDAEDARSREGSQQPEDPAQAEQQRQTAWYK